MIIYFLIGLLTLLAFLYIDVRESENRENFDLSFRICFIALFLWPIFWAVLVYMLWEDHGHMLKSKTKRSVEDFVYNLFK